jgi:hypothetical protein
VIVIIIYENINVLIDIYGDKEKFKKKREIHQVLILLRSITHESASVSEFACKLQDRLVSFSIKLMHTPSF